MKNNFTILRSRLFLKVPFVALYLHTTHLYAHVGTHEPVCTALYITTGVTTLVLLHELRLYWTLGASRISSSVGRYYYYCNKQLLLLYMHDSLQYKNNCNY